MLVQCDKCGLVVEYDKYTSNIMIQLKPPMNVFA